MALLVFNVSCKNCFVCIHDDACVLGYNICSGELVLKGGERSCF